MQGTGTADTVIRPVAGSILAPALSHGTWATTLETPEALRQHEANTNIPNVAVRKAWPACESILEGNVGNKYQVKPLGTEQHDLPTSYMLSQRHQFS
jgi:hypothetical protein